MYVLDQVLTITEVMRDWGKSRQGVLNAIHNVGPRALVARQAGDGSNAVWLIDRASVVRRWGLPVKDGNDANHG